MAGASAGGRMKRTSRRFAGFARANRHLLMVALFSVALISLFSWLRSKYPRAGGGGSWPAVRSALLDAGLALAVALLVAGVVGLLIDRAARARIAERLAEGWLWGLLGQDAPPQLQIRAKEILDNRVVLSLDELRIAFSVHATKPDVLKLELQSLETGTNYGPEPFRLQPSTMLIPSVQGEQSVVTHWEFEVYPRDRAAPARRVCLDANALNRVGTGPVVKIVSASDLTIPEHLEARRGDSFRLMRRATVYLSSAGCIPLTRTRPAIETALTLAGPARDALVFDVQSSRGALTATTAGDELSYSGGPALSREWFWVCWRPRDASSAS